MAFFNPDDILNKFGLPNYIQNGNFEMYSTFAAQVAGATKWNAYKDAAQATPVDGTGGTATVIRNASVGSGSQLRGTRSWQITKTGNAQGEGYSQDFTIDPADKSKSINISFDFSAGSAYTTGDLAVYVYDITNATLITPASVNIPSGSGTFSTVFAATTSTSYRLIFHCAASNATTTDWSMTCDNIQVSRKDVTIGPAVTDWITFTPTGNWTTNTTYTGEYRRVGDSAEFQIYLSLSGAPTSASLIVNLPSGIVIDTTKVPAATSAAATHLGTAHIRDVGSGSYIGIVNYQSTSSVQVQFNGTGNTGSVNQANPITFGANDYISLHFMVPVVGWSSNLQVADRALEEFASNSDTTNADNTTSFAYGVSGSAFPAVTTSTKVKRIRFQTPIQPTDTLIVEVRNATTQAWSPYNNSDAGSIAYVRQGSTEYGLYISPNVSGSTTDVNVYFCATAVPSGLTFGAAGAAWTSLTFIDRWRVRKVTQGALVGTDQFVVAADAQTAAGISIPNNTATRLDYATINNDTTNSITTGANWTWTCPEDGFYSFAATASFGSTTSATATQLRITVNFGADSQDNTNFVPAGSSTPRLQCSGVRYIRAGTQVYVTLTHNFGFSVTANANANRFQITKINPIQTVNGSSGPTPTVSVIGTATNDNAASGYLGEYLESIVSSSTACPTSGNYADATSLVLTPGDWDLSGIIIYRPSGATLNAKELGITTTSGNSGSGLVYGNNHITNDNAATSDLAITIPLVRASISTQTTYYLKMRTTYASGSPLYVCSLKARRVR